ncbi:hypothetical protein [Qipengyuania oceanensis]|uniref:Ferrochelatase n=1 Tax=Qipengyuania oceanensis TaxID=1463597 RepID=A0A844YBH8_9SPHN|nr:hypothetical protein [Qipengyuania oceanensis]MXO61561.1 hypothetical protein [Qipengyuania oceanensis]
MRKLVSAAVAAGLLAGTSVSASAAPAMDRASAPAAESNEMGDALGLPAIVHIALLAGLVIAVFLIIDDDDDPVSA